ncbi:MAG: aminotransferase [Benniella sp.]|nr:MAG: aminotransferase [Benniella sp.]
MGSIQLLETILYDPKDGVFLRDYHCERMIESAKALAPFANDQEKFLSELIPTPSEISTKLDAAIANAGKNARQRLRVLLAFDGAITIQSSQLPRETDSFEGTSIIVILDKHPTPKNNPFLLHKTTEREVYNEARKRNGLGPISAPQSNSEEPFDVILYNEDNEIMEATIANIAIEVPNPESGNLEWITPPVSSGLLAGTMRRYLLEKGELHEGVITLDELKEAARENRRIKCFNSVRREYPVILKF